MSGFKITTYSAAASSQSIVESNEVSEHLRRLGLEWKNADWPHEQQIVITIAPVPDTVDQDRLREQVRSAAANLEETGLL